MIKEKMYKRFTMQNNTVYIDILPKIVSSYNNSKNRSIGLTPNEGRKKENYGRVFFNLYGAPQAAGRASHTKSTGVKFTEIGHTVRISKYK